MERVRVRPDEDAGSGRTGTFCARVIVELEHGGSEEARAGEGGGPGRRMDEGELRAKLEDCASRVLAPQRIAGLWERLGRVECLGSVAELTRAMDCPDRAGGAR